ncbi:MAG: RNA 2',3'-cyclic phosphodiesterase [Acidisphaera sp.]|nr:RNA 2',3'-cyclic phosphodiesterase [Acidisphaera sp.]
MRLFVALDLPWELRERLAGLSGGIPGARWVQPENYHLTLRFIGEVAPHRAEEIDLALAGLRARGFPLSLAGLGTFGRNGKSSRGSSLWVGVERNPALEHLQAKVEVALQRAGLDADRRRFAPHVTLARLDSIAEPRLASYIQAHNLFRADPVAIDHFTLFSSHRGKDQPSYIGEAEYPLT